MLHIQRFAAVLLFSIFGYALQAQPSTYIVHLGVGQTSTHRDLLMFPSGALIMTGTVDYPPQGFLGRFDNDGQMIWSGLLPSGQQFDRLYQGPGEHFFATGMRDTSGTDPRILVGYFDGNGQNLWLKTLDDGKYHISSTGTVLTTGNLVLVAGGESTYGSQDYVASLDTLGNILWEKCFDPTFSPRVSVFKQNEVILAQHNNWETNISHLDGNGNVIWRTGLPMGMNEISVFRDSMIYVAGTFFGFQDLSLFVEMDTAGLVTQAWDWAGIVNPGRIRFNTQGDFLMAGTSLVENPGTGPYYESAIAIYRPNINVYALEGMKLYYGSHISQMWTSPDGGYVVGVTDFVLPYTIILEKRDSLLSTGCDSVPTMAPITPVSTLIQGTPSTATTYPVGNARNLPTAALTPNTLGYTIQCAVGVQPPATIDMECWPNPATSAMNLTWNETEMGLGGMSMQVWSSSGQLVVSTNLENDGAERIDLSGFVRGCYHIRLIGEGNRMGSLTFVKE